MKEFTESMKAVAEYIVGKEGKSDNINEWLHKNTFSKILEAYITHGDGGVAAELSKFEEGAEQTG